ncbi:MAG: hypothetical protein QOH71_3799 [Blastocatellia bacterium]|jgi:hypothetical protein|nr:hypothetical protein [Blastocatellia bacterium]
MSNHCGESTASSLTFQSLHEADYRRCSYAQLSLPGCLSWSLLSILKCACSGLAKLRRIVLSTILTGPVQTFSLLGLIEGNGPGP